MDLKLPRQAKFSFLIGENQDTITRVVIYIKIVVSAPELVSAPQTGLMSGPEGRKMRFFVGFSLSQKKLPPFPFSFPLHSYLSRLFSWGLK